MDEKYYIDLAKVRLERSKELLEEAKYILNFLTESVKFSVSMGKILL